MAEKELTAAKKKSLKKKLKFVLSGDRTEVMGNRTLPSFKTRQVK